MLRNFATERKIAAELEKIRHLGCKIIVVKNSLRVRRWSYIGHVTISDKLYFFKIPKLKSNEKFSTSVINDRHHYLAAYHEKESLEWAKNILANSTGLAVSVQSPVDFYENINALIYQPIKAPLFWKVMRAQKDANYDKALYNLGFALGLLHNDLRNNPQKTETGRTSGQSLGDFELRDIFMQNNDLVLFDINIFQKNLNNHLGFDFGRIVYSFMNIWWRRIRYVIPPENLITHWIQQMIAGYTMTAPQLIDQHFEEKMVAAGDCIRAGLQNQLQNYFKSLPPFLYTTLFNYYTKRPFLIYKRILSNTFSKKVLYD